MKPKTIIKFLSGITGLIAISMLLPWLWAVRAQSRDAHAFLSSFAITAFAALCMYKYAHDAKDTDFGQREAFLCVTLAWIFASAAGALPFMLGGYCRSFTDAFFETMSGFTTTGASIFRQVEPLPPGILLWRALTQWLGGMGIVVLFIALVPMFGGGLAQLFKAESPGPVLEKINPTINSMSQSLWYAYLAITAAGILLLRLGGMTMLDAVCHSFSAVSTGGFSTKNASVGYFNSAYIDYVLSALMFLCGINFSLHIAVATKHTFAPYKDAECLFYTKIVAVSTLLLAWIIFRGHFCGNAELAFRQALFQVTSIITTTGFATADFSLWPSAALLIMFLLMICGGCAGSTAGGIKCTRLLTATQAVKSEFVRMLHPNAVVAVRVGDNTVNPRQANSAALFCVLYFIVFVISALIICLTGETLLVSLSAVAATLSNIGPGFGKVGPAGNFAGLTPLAKWVCSFCMLTGRLELYTLLVLLTKDEWRK